MILSHRVIFGDTDQMGIVYYANYLRYFEAGRAEYLRQQGRSYAEISREGIALPVVEAHCAYRRPALYEDLLSIVVSVSEIGLASMRFAYQILRDETLLADGWTRHAVTGPDGKPRPMPPFLRELLERPLVP